MGKTKKKDHRSASLTRRQSMREVKQSFLIVCEGVRTEPDYFKAFRNPLFQDGRIRGYYV